MTVLRQMLASRPGHYGSEDAVRLVTKLVTKREQAIEHDIFSMGALLFAEKPGALVRRWEAYWNLWRGKA